MLIDTHAHLHVKEFDEDREQVIERAGKAGIGLLLNVGFEPEGNKRAAKLAERSKNIYWTAGIHPHNADEATPEALEWIRTTAKKPIGKKLKALGETGLDYFKNHCPREMQLDAFGLQLDLATELDLPLIVHCREAFKDALETLKEKSFTRAVFHCFTGTLDEARACLERGFYLSFTGICTYPNARTVREAVQLAPHDRIMIETDCPFLAPQAHRGERNEPAFLRETMKKIALIKGIPQDKLENILEENTRRFFGLPGYRP